MWCTTNYVFYGDQVSIKDIKLKLDYLNTLSTPLVPNGFGKLWCGCLNSLLDGGDWEDCYCRGEIDSYELINNNSIHLLVSSAWVELSEWREFIMSKYSGIKIVYLAEEPGNGLYETNDVEGLYYPERYIIDSSHLEDYKYFEALGDVCDYVHEITGIKVYTKEEIQSALSRQVEIETINNRRQKIRMEIYYEFHEICVV